MRTALSLRVREAWRRGGAALLATAFTGVFLIAALGGESAAARYAFATDLAAALAFVGALFYGALPLATDRERRRLLIPCASPVTPASWALGNALGAAVVGALLAALLFAAAGLGTAVGGKAGAHKAWTLRRDLYATFHRSGQDAPYKEGRAKNGVHWVAPNEWIHILELGSDVRSVRFKTRAAPVAQIEGTPTHVTIVTDDAHKPVVTPIGGFFEAPRGLVGVSLQNKTADLYLGLVLDRSVALGDPVSFPLTALMTGLPIALGVAFLAALAATAAALLSGPVAALFAGVVLILGALRGFLLDAIQHAGAAHAGEGTGLQETSSGFIELLLGAIPDLSSLDHSASLSRGEWMAAAIGTSLLSGALFLCSAALLAFVVGGYGVRTRRLR